MDAKHAPGSSKSSHGVRHTKVCANRKFPEGCNPSASRVKEKENADGLTKTTGSAKGKHVYSRALACTGNIPVNKVDKTNEVVRSISFAAQADTNKVKETLKMFHEIFKQLSDEWDRNQSGPPPARLDLVAAYQFKRSPDWVHPVKRFGEIPGISIGDKFQSRTELSIVGLHGPYMSGIDSLELNGKKFATSIVDSGVYENQAKTPDVLIYLGQGGQEKRGMRTDQKLRSGNIALVNSMESKYPVRVIKKKTSGGDGESTFTYDGLYLVDSYRRERDSDHKLVFKFELHRMSDQQRVSTSGCKKRGSKDLCLVSDVSQGKEEKVVRVMNGVDDEKPGKFGYITENIYPEWCRKIGQGGCDCLDGCSDAGRCVCILKNGCEIPYSENGALVGGKGVVYECGRFCTCPPSCANRVSQHGSRYQLEIYRTEKGGWGVRSRSYISSGSFVCEFVGKLLTINKANREFIDNYFICSPHEETETGFIVDASKIGNVGRFIRHSCSSPTLVTQRVLYDHGDGRMPHIMFFAAKNIPPLQELTYDSNHLLG